MLERQSGFYLLSVQQSFQLYKFLYKLCTYGYLYTTIMNQTECHGKNEKNKIHRKSCNTIFYKNDYNTVELQLSEKSERLKT